MADHEDQEIEDSLRDNLEHAITELSYALSKSFHQSIQEAVAALRVELAAERDVAAAHFVAALRAETAELQGGPKSAEG